MIDINELSLNLDECENYKQFSRNDPIEIDEKTESLLKNSAEKMSSISNGVGKTAAKRYLLYNELGKSSEQISGIEDVSAKTVNNQTGRVKNKVLSHIDLAKAVCDFRSARSQISNPELPEGFEITETTRIERGDLSVSVEYKNGTAGTFYSWCYSGKSVFQEGDYQYILKIDFKINENLGVILKHTRRGVKKLDWERPPAYSQRSDYHMYPLPNSAFPTGPDGSLFDGIANHLFWDVANIPFEESDVEHNTQGPTGYDSGYWDPRSIVTDELNNKSESPNVYATYSPESISHLIELGAGPSIVDQYTRSKLRQRFLERLLGIYPLNYPTELPIETWEKVFDLNRRHVNTFQILEGYSIEPCVDMQRESTGGNKQGYD